MSARRLIELGDNPTQKAVELKKLNAMVEYAEAQVCRRRVILSYFGEYRIGACDNCDICLEAPEEFDATDDVKLALMAVYELKQRFGMGYVVDILRGSKSARILDAYHDGLAAYGTGKHRPLDDWMSILRQLVQKGLLIQDAENYGILKLTPETRPILRDGVRVSLAVPRVKVQQEKPATKGKAKKGKKGKKEATYEDNSLFQKLRTLRRQIADREQVPAYIICGDETLRQLADKKGFKVAIDGVDWHDFDVLSFRKLRPDFVKLSWNNHLVTLAEDDLRVLVEGIRNLDESTKVVLSRCDDPRAFLFSRGLGIRYVQGRLADQYFRSGDRM